ncbi:hypothetical protein ACFOWA_15570 [Pedobacter lithocola]|uniref:Uncharacterized protein n=1 Tax=Pedobacter lithocola TaxID=1908239 RepID=A0ABV8PBF5_9SPHI
MKKLLFIIVMCLSLVHFSYAQMLDISKLGLPISVTDEYLNNLIPRKAFIYSINIAVNKLGIIDSIYFSKTENIDLGKAINLEKIKATIMSNTIFFKRYKNCVVIAPVMIINLNDQFISFQNELLREWSALFPDIQKFKNRRIVLCKPINRSYILDYD